MFIACACFPYDTISIIFVLSIDQYNTQYNTQYGSGSAPATSTVVVQQPSAFVVGLQFRDTPIRINCQFCHADVITATHYEVGTLTWVMCFLVGIVGYVHLHNVLQNRM